GPGERGDGRGEAPVVQSQDEEGDTGNSNPWRIGCSVARMEREMPEEPAGSGFLQRVRRTVRQDGNRPLWISASAGASKHRKSRYHAWTETYVRFYANFAQE